MVYLIGVNHQVQDRANMTALKASTIAEFQEHLRTAARERAAEILAEEMSRECLHGRPSTVEEVAAELALEHRLCDADNAERARLGIPPGGAGSFDPRRLLYWREHLPDAGERSVLFVCGSGHLGDFSALLQSRGIPAEIVSDGWGHELDSNEHVGQQVLGPGVINARTGKKG